MKKLLIMLSAGFFFVSILFGVGVIDIKGIYPQSGAPHSVVIIKGQGFALGNQEFIWTANMENTPPPGFVEFNGVRAAVTLWQDHLIMVEVPENAHSGPIRLVHRGGLSVMGNHFEIEPIGGPDEGRRPYSFEERQGISDMDVIAFNRGTLYPPAGYYYAGFRPSPFTRRGMWNRQGDGMLDFFLVSGPILSLCGIPTGLDNVMVFPREFVRQFDSRTQWWDQKIQPARRKYRFEE